MDILYKGTDLPNSWEFLQTLEANVSQETLASYFAAGRAINQNYNILVRDGNSIRCWYPKATPVSPVKQWDEFDFRKRFTAAERKAIRNAAKTNADIEDFLDMLATAGRTGTAIKSNDAMLNAALDALEIAGLIAAGRKAQILGS